MKRLPAILFFSSEEESFYRQLTPIRRRVNERYLTIKRAFNPV